MSVERIVAGLIAIVLLAAAIVTLRRAQRRLDTPIDVVCIFLGAWGVVLAVFAVPLISYSSTSAETWLMIYGSMVSAAVGCLLAWRVFGSVPRPIDEQDRALRATIDAQRVRLVWLASALLGLVGFAAFVYAVDRATSWQHIFNEPDTVRELTRDSEVFQDTYGFWKLLTYFNQIAFIFWTIGLRMRSFTARWRVAGMLGFVSLIPFLFTADRNLLAAGLALTLMLHLLWPWRGSWRRVAIVLLAGVLVTAGALTAIGNRYGGSLEDHPELAPHVKVSVLEPLAIPYLYLTANIPTFGQLTQDDLAPRTDGQLSIMPAVKAAERAGVIATAPVETGAFYSIPFETFSNYSWLGRFWLDFRAVGVLLLPLLVGFAATAARLRLAVKPTFLSLWTAGILLYVIVYSPLSNVLSTSLTWQYLLLGPILAVFLQPGVWRNPLSRLRTQPILATGAAAAAVVVPAGLIFVALSHSRTPPRIVAVAELRDAVDKARYVYAQEGRYPVPLALATRLGVTRPEVSFRPQKTYIDPLPPPGVIAVFSQPKDVFLRLRVSDGRVYEVHRTEADGGITFGPGTRDR